MTDPAEIRAEGRRLLANAATLPPGVDPRIYLGRFLRDHADVLLADPAPVGLSQEDRELVEEIRNGTYGRPVGHVEALLAIIDRLSPSTEENVCGSCGKNHSEDPLCTN